MRSNGLKIRVFSDLYEKSYVFFNHLKISHTCEKFRRFSSGDLRNDEISHTCDLRNDEISHTCGRFSISPMRTCWRSFILLFNKPTWVVENVNIKIMYKQRYTSTTSTKEVPTHLNTYCIENIGRFKVTVDLLNISPFLKCASVYF